MYCGKTRQHIQSCHSNVFIEQILSGNYAKESQQAPVTDVKPTISSPKALQEHDLFHKTWEEMKKIAQLHLSQQKTWVVLHFPLLNLSRFLYQLGQEASINEYRKTSQFCFLRGLQLAHLSTFWIPASLRGWLEEECKRAKCWKFRCVRASLFLLTHSHSQLPLFIHIGTWDNRN